jgi:hypothetical protein
MTSQVSANVSFTGSITAQALYGVSNTATTAYVPQDFSSSGLNIPAYVVSNTATTANTVAYSSFGPFANEGSLYFPNGTGPYYGTYVNFPSSAPVCFDWTTLDFTVELWFYPTAFSQGGANAGGIFKRITWPVSTYQFEMTISNSGVVQFYDGASGAAISPSGTATLNAWNHISACVSGSTAYVSLNGVVGSAAKGSFTYNSALGFVISSGIPSNSGWSGVNGYISNLRIVRGAALYTSSFTPSTGPLQPIQGVTQAGKPYGTVLLLRNAPAPGRVLTQKFAGANSGQVLSFPPAAMTGYATVLNAGYGQGVYVASASSEYSASLLAWNPFGSGVWATYNGNYTGAGPQYAIVFASTVDVNGASYQGDWLQLQMPSSIVISTYQMGATSNFFKAPYKWWLLGSRDGTTWFLVDSQTGFTWAASQTTTFPVSSSQAFTYLRIVINAVSGGGLAELHNVRFNGTIESVNVTADGRVGLGVVNPTRALEVAGDLVVSGTVSGGNPTTFRNAIINGDMRINQRGISTNWASPTAIGAGSATYTLDRWNPFRNTGQTGCAVAQGTLATTDAPYSQGLQYYLRVGRVSGDTGTQLIAASYQLETRDSLRLAGQPTTVSFWYRTGSGFSGTLNINYFYGTGTDQGWRVGPTGSAVILNPSFSNSNAWQYASFTAFAPLVTNQLFIGPQYTPTGTAGGFDYFDITGVQLEKGSVATPFEVRPYATELALCQRYYWRLNGGSPIGTVGAYTTLSGYCPITFPVPMRAAGAALGCNTATPPPAAGTTITLSNSDVSVYYSGTSQIATSIRNSTTYTSTTGGEIFIVWPTAVTLNGGYLVEVPTGKFIEFSAEL